MKPAAAQASLPKLQLYPQKAKMLVHDIDVIDDFVDGEQFNSLSKSMQHPIWSYGWRAARDLGYGLWHSHFAGGDKDSCADCEGELAESPRI
jgi:hypothetical protein